MGEVRIRMMNMIKGVWGGLSWYGKKRYNNTVIFKEYEKDC